MVRTDLVDRVKSRKCSKTQKRKEKGKLEKKEGLQDLGCSEVTPNYLLARWTSKADGGMVQYMFSHASWM